MNARQWIAELSAARKRDKDWREDGTKILEIYCGKKQVAFNILYSNTETLLPSLYSAIPRPVVDRRFKDDDAIGKAAAEAGRRGLEFLIDTNVEGYETFDEGARAAVVDALLPGRGITQIKYDAEIVGDDESKAAEEAEDAPMAYKASELVCVDACKWDRYLEGYATKWSQVPWIAFGTFIDKDEATKLFGKKKAGALQYANESDEADKDGERKANLEEMGERRVALIWRIWHKESKKVLFVSEHYADSFLKVTPDPLGVTGFFPIPKPLMLVEKSNDLSPTALYTLYKKQAEELYDLSRRIIKIVHAIRARGLYDGEFSDDIRQLMEADDNMLVAASSNASIASEKGIENAIWFMPIVDLVTTLRELMAAREACKAVIWEIMGIADIMRGASMASETLGAQEIKQAWGSLRLKRMQKEVQRYCRDMLRIMLEVAVNKFSEDTWAKMTGLPFLTEAQAASVDQQMQAMQAQMQAAQMAVDPQTGQPAQPDQAMQQQFQQLQAESQKPRWADVLKMLRDDMQRAYRIDIETNSTVEPEAADDQKNISEVMNAMGQFLAGVNPLIEQGIMPFEAAQTMLLAIVRRYRFGSEFEDQLKAMKPPQPKDDGSQAKLQMEQEKHQAEMQAKNMEQQGKQAELQQKSQLDEQKMQMEMAKMKMEFEFAQQEHQFRMAELSAKAQMTQVVNDSKLKVAMATAAMKEKSAAPPAPQGAQQ